jgi:septum site-determining protein MinC
MPDTGLKIQIKGVKEGLLVSLGEGEWAALEQTLLEQIRQQGSFFQGAKVALDVGNHVLRAAELGALRDKLADVGVMLWAILSNSPTTEQTAQMLGLATRLSVPKPERTVRPLDTTLEGDNAILVHRTLRSGFRVISKGHVIVVGDVNPGAEIVAGGSVVVWGRMRGLVQAGSGGDQSAVVCALELEPTQLRIANIDYELPRKKNKSFPEIAQLQDDRVVATPWIPRQK